MLVKPKFNVGDTAISMVGVKIVKIEIDEINFDGMFSKECNEVNVRYQTVSGCEFDEDELFESKEALIDYLKKTDVITEEGLK
jgi:hypothetical protein